MSDDKQRIIIIGGGVKIDEHNGLEIMKNHCAAQK